MGNEAKEKILAALERLRSEHRALDERIRALEGRGSITVAEVHEIERLERLKLAKKDELAAVVRLSGNRR